MRSSDTSPINTVYTPADCYWLLTYMLTWMLGSGGIVGGLVLCWLHDLIDQLSAGIVGTAAVLFWTGISYAISKGISQRCGWERAPAERAPAEDAPLFPPSHGSINDSQAPAPHSTPVVVCCC